MIKYKKKYLKKFLNDTFFYQTGKLVAMHDAEIYLRLHSRVANRY